tara:strand:- start:2846 stop:3778 length:933 start_codon:yes stop_codon:yes gene_type:complete
MRKSIFILLIGACSALSAQKLENPGFENWETDGGQNEPVDWSSIKTAMPSSLAGLAPKVMSESSTAHSGSKSVKLENKSAGFGIIAAGIMTNGRVIANFDPAKSSIGTETSDPKWNSPLKYRPDSLVGWFQYEPAGSDVGTIQALIHKGSAKIPDAAKTNYIGFAEYRTPSVKTTSWVRFSIPFIYTSTDIPEYILLILTSGNGTSAINKSVAYFDDLELIYNKPISVIEKNPLSDVSIYGSQNQINFDLTDLKPNESVKIQVFDMVGKERINEVTSDKYRVSFDNLTSGIYVCVVKINNQYYRKKVVVH